MNNIFRKNRQFINNNSVKIKTIYENGDLRSSDSAPKKDLKQDEIDIKALQQKRAQAEFTRYNENI